MNEATECVHALQDSLRVNIHLEDESDKFLQKLAGVTDPEEKRKIIGNQFIYSFESVASKFGDMEYFSIYLVGSDFISQRPIHILVKFF